MQSLRHAELKTARALDDLDAFGVELRRFYAVKPYTITQSDDIETGRHIIRVQMKDISDRTAIPADDCVHNLRCALHQAIFPLAIYATRNIPARGRLWRSRRM